MAPHPCLACAALSWFAVKEQNNGHCIFDAPVRRSVGLSQGASPIPCLLAQPRAPALSCLTQQASRAARSTMSRQSSGQAAWRCGLACPASAVEAPQSSVAPPGARAEQAARRQHHSSRRHRRPRPNGTASYTDGYRRGCAAAKASSGWLDAQTATERPEEPTSVAALCSAEASSAELRARQAALDKWCFCMALFDFNPPWEPLWCRICRLVVAAMVNCVALALFRLLWPLTSVSLVAQSVAHTLLIAHDWAGRLVRVGMQLPTCMAFMAQDMAGCTTAAACDRLPCLPLFHRIPSSIQVQAADHARNTGSLPPAAGRD